VVKLLLDAGADVDSKDEDGHTPFSLAKSRGHKGVMELLLGAGAERD